ncbi:hypothetical protein FD14_GL002735 [Secundilactobacillus similis DSM 23365 = JCM 2765]|uniref:Uncharacterized protein n=1 Tax=Secundilactobacillus similis DSM 23365 = JCM 2765 TaxID=1423804 RepID=A0A0R2EJG4_9LACO|nr:hypothetical protein FD14_GL002735 [Secundilactobacillus similis DSM 23365 = JCM 2765]
MFKLPETMLVSKVPVVSMPDWQKLAHQYEIHNCPATWSQASEVLRWQKNIGYLETFTALDDIYAELSGNDFLRDIAIDHPEQVHTYWVANLSAYVLIID